MKTRFLFLLNLLFILSCNAQIRKTQRIQMKDYPSFYENLTGNLNKVIAHKQDFYGKPLSLFLSELENQNIHVNSYTPGFDNTSMKLEFVDDWDTYEEANKNNYKMPYIIINLKTPFDYQKAMVLLDKNHSYWGEEEENFYKDLIIKDIQFMDVSGLKTQQLKAK